ncbi:MAG: cadmium-translocating P-type ATPase [Epulopiscium sp.]|jgi:Cd2+/Zn2+-exporting ATPase|nr:cadmium-translocating P-type ATPase [Candidatus Epulonipiscium sp.]
MDSILKYHLEGLDCAHCAAKIEEDVKKLEELKNPQINLLKQELVAEKAEGYDAEKILEKIKAIVHQYEPDVKVTSKQKSQARTIPEDTWPELKKKVFRFSLGGILFLAAVFTKEYSISSYVFLLSYAIFGWDVIWRAIKNISKGQVFDENFLMTISTIGAIFLKELPEAVFVMMFYQIGEAFQDYAVDRSRKSIISLMEIRPEYAVLLTDDGAKEISPEEILVGDLILVKPGERIPLDGIIAEGEGGLDTSVLTGESVPRMVQTGDAVYSGSVNLNGVLKIKVTKPFEESTVMKILGMVENASAKKSKTERFITKFARVYTPVVVALAVLLAVVPPLIGGGEFQVWLSRAFIFLVISCPCALVLSVPLGFFSGIGEASRQGILVKGSNYMDVLKNVSTVVFDKTGTLTKGIFEVTKIDVEEGYTEEKLLNIAAIGEKNSKHPIAKAVVEYYEKMYHAVNEEAQNYQELSGYGISYTLDGSTINAGNYRFMEKQGVLCQEYKGMGSVVYLAKDKNFVGKIIVSDTLKQGSKKAVESLRANGVKKIVMLSGDNYETAKAISDELGLDEFYAELLPLQKVEKAEELLQQEKGFLLFAGDGMNDAPVLSRADIGVAMGGIGSDAAIEAADMVIMNDDLEKISVGMKIATATHRIVSQNIVFALGVKIIVLILGALGIAQMWTAVFADVGVAFLAILNSMRPKMK